MCLWPIPITTVSLVARPLFTLAGIELEEVVIHPGDDIVEIIASKDLTGVDGILTAGGDGTHRAIFDGLVQHQKRISAASDDKNIIDLDTDNPTLPKMSTPVGILPTGSGNATSFVMNMTHDLQSCVANVIIGNTRFKAVSFIYRVSLFKHLKRWRR